MPSAPMHHTEEESVLTVAGVNLPLPQPSVNLDINLQIHHLPRERLMVGPRKIVMGFFPSFFNKALLSVYRSCCVGLWIYS